MLLVVLGGEVLGWEVRDTGVGRIAISPIPTTLSLRAIIESEAEYPAGDVFITANLVLVADSLAEGRCLDLVVGEGGDSRVLEDEDCDGVVSGLISPDACEGRLPGACTLTGDVILSFTEEVELLWQFEVTILGNIEGCRGEPPLTTVVVDVPD